MVVFVLSRDGKPLMPTGRFGKVKRLLKEGRAKVVTRKPFTIQLLYDTTSYIQPVRLGFDLGRTVGFAVVIDNRRGGKVVEKGEIRLRTDISELLLRGREFRRFRRYRKTPYRKPRFLNRRLSEGWLPPSVKAQLEHTADWIERLSRYLPEPEVVVEVAKFDLQKLENPSISGKVPDGGPLRSPAGKAHPFKGGMKGDRAWPEP